MSKSGNRVSGVSAGSVVAAKPPMENRSSELLPHLASDGGGFDQVATAHHLRATSSATGLENRLPQVVIIGLFCPIHADSEALG